MTISTFTNRWQYSGDNVTTDFTFNNKIFEDTDLEVYVDGVLKTLTTDYTVTGLGEELGGTVQFLVAPATSTVVLLVRNVPDTQGSDYPIGGVFPAEQVEDDVDKRTVITQQLAELFTRSLILAQSDTSGVNTTLPTPAAGEVIGWDQLASGITSYDGTETDVVFINNVKDQIVGEAQAILDQFLAITQNITISTEFPDNEVGNNGDIWLVVPA